MTEPQFSILVVCLNPGDKLKMTLESIRGQTFQNYEVIIKDGGSSDGSLAYLKDVEKTFPSLRLIEKKDTGIYDAMNQAVLEAGGKYLYFLNCGDAFYHENVLMDMNREIVKHSFALGVYYGNIYDRMTGREVASNPDMDAFGCYRNVPCHQACFYDKRLLAAHPFETKYRVRADYEQFLWCFFTEALQQKAVFVYTDMIVADYEGGGFSETKKNRKISAAEHKEIVRKYMPAGKVWKYRIFMWVTLAPLRTWMARNPVTSGLYNQLKKIYYEKGQGMK